MKSIFKNRDVFRSQAMYSTYTVEQLVGIFKIFIRIVACQTLFKLFKTQNPDRQTDTDSIVSIAAG